MANRVRLGSNATRGALAVVLLIAVCLAITAGGATAHTPHDVVTVVVPSPGFATDHTVFVVSRDELLRSTDGGQTWQEIVSGIVRADVDGLAAAPTDASTLYAVLSGGVFRSTDHGSSWQPTAFANRTDIAEIVVSRTNATTVFAGSSGGLFRSTTGGQSWASVGSFGAVTALEAPVAGRVVVGDASGAIFVSTNDGTTWSQAHGTPSGVHISALATPPGTPTPVFAGTSSGRLYESNDSGATFTATGSGLPSQAINGITTSSRDATTPTVWVSTVHDVYRSTNGGSTFAASASGLTTDPQATQWGVPDFYGVVAAPTSSGDVLFTAAFTGLFRSADLGSSWSELQTQVEQIAGLAVSPNFAQDHILVVSTYVKGAFISHDAGATWTPIDVGLGAPQVGNNEYLPLWREHDVVYLPNVVHDHTLFLATINDLRRSTDAGESWQTINPEPPVKGDHTRYVIATSPNYTTDHTLYLGSEDGHVLRSTASGDAGTWTKIGTLQGFVRSIMVSPAFTTDHTIFVGTLFHVYRSTNAGATWQQMAPKGGEAILAISPAYASDHTVFAGTQHGMYVTRNGGQTWTLNSTRPLSASAQIEAVSVPPTFASDHLVLVSVSGRGLYRSADGGTTFAATGPSLLASNIIISDYEGANPTSLPIVFSPTYSTDHTVFGWFDNVVVRSADAGAHWTVLSLPPAASFLAPPSTSEPLPVPTVREGGPGTQTTVQIPVDLSWPLRKTITVHWHTVDGTTTGVASSKDGDFVAASGALTYPISATREYISVVVNGDAKVEPDEALLVQLTSPTNATLTGDGQVKAVIVNDDP